VSKLEAFVRRVSRVANLSKEIFNEIRGFGQGEQG
jgi:hypothetical protein